MIRPLTDAFPVKSIGSSVTSSPSSVTDFSVHGGGADTVKNTRPDAPLNWNAPDSSTVPLVSGSEPPKFMNGRDVSAGCGKRRSGPPPRGVRGDVPSNTTRPVTSAPLPVTTRTPVRSEPETTIGTDANSPLVAPGRGIGRTSIECSPGVTPAIVKVPSVLTAPAPKLKPPFP